MARCGRHGEPWRCQLRHGIAGTVWRGQARSRHGMAGMARKAALGNTRQAWLGRPGLAPQGRQGTA